MTSRLLYQAPSSAFAPSFWEELYRLKLNVLKLDASEQEVVGVLRISDGRHPESLQFSNSSHSSQSDLDRTSSPSHFYRGVVVNMNTVEEFKTIDKKKLLFQMAIRLLASIISREALKDTTKLLNFLLLTFSDLKAYRFTYWMVMPAVIASDEFVFQSSPIRRLTDVPLGTGVSGRQLSAALYQCIATHITTTGSLPPVFVVHNTATMTAKNDSTDADSTTFFNPATLRILTLLEAIDSCILQQHPDSAYIIILDSNNTDAGFGWIARNLLAVLSLLSAPTAADFAVKLIGLRGPTPVRLQKTILECGFGSSAAEERLLSIAASHDVESDCSIFAEVQITATALGTLRDELSGAIGIDILATSSASLTTAAVKELLQQALDNGQLPSLKTVGWETNERGKPGPRVADLSQSLDSRFLMSQAVDLNLRLMKWRMWPALDTDKLAQTRCLLFGAGTLGCAVARALLGWGVRNITLVDNGRVSYSNPARQCLFEFEDCEQRRFKSEAAAMHLKRIFPDVNSEGHILNIPMPGHPLLVNPSSAATVTSTIAATDASIVDATSTVASEDERSFHALDELVRTHDVCFALTDSREARWLPTIMCAAHDKLIINAALGFDSYLVMRHGSGCSISTGSGGAKEGCYFCNDVVAATNSQKDRSMDQMCTVTRPGLSFIAAAQCVELMVAILHHVPTGEGSSSSSESDSNDNSPPHQIRGSLAGFTQMLLNTPAFSCCTACSDAVVAEYRNSGFDFVRRVCEDSSILESISGVQQMNEMVDLDLCVESDDEF